MPTIGMEVKKQAMRNKPLSIDPWQNYKNIFGFVERGISVRAIKLHDPLGLHL